MNEKTWQVSVGLDIRDIILSIQTKIKADMGYDVTHRAIVTRAIHKLHDGLVSDAQPK